MDDIATGDVGGRIGRARRERGLSLRDAAASTKLSAAVLRAIERNDFESLPGGLYRRAYLRTVAREVGLDPDEIAADYTAHFEPPIEPGPVADHASPRRRLWAWQPATWVTASALALIAMAGVAAWALRPRGSEPVDAPSPPAVEGAAPVRAIALSHAPNEVPLRIEIAAHDPCWISAASDGERVVYRLVQPGERVVLEAQHSISLRLGDGGAVTLAMNGGLPRSAGLRGQVVEFEVTPETVEHLRAAAAGATLGG